MHEEQDNIENIWSFGSVDRLLLGLCNQPSQRRDEFIGDELTNHLFQFQGTPFGLDLASINIQRGRDHGLPPYTAWREPCGLKPVKSWLDLQKIMSPETAHRFKHIYKHIDDIDLFSGGLAEKPVRGGLVGPTFACIIAQQFLNLRKGDRFWYENDGFESSFTPAQLQQIRHITLGQVLCQTLTEIETVQPFVFLSVDSFRNLRLSCDDSRMNSFDLSAWVERRDGNFREEKKRKTRKTTTTAKPKLQTKPQKLKFKISNITTDTIRIKDKEYSSATYLVGQIPNRPTFDNYNYNYNNRRTTTIRNDVTYLFGYVQETTTPIPKPLEVNINIQYYPRPVSKTTTTTTKKPKRQTNKKKRTKPTTKRPSNIYKPSTQLVTNGPNDYNYPIYFQSNKPSSVYSDDFSVQRPQLSSYYDVRPANTDFYNKRRPDIDKVDSLTNSYQNRPTYDLTRPTYSIGYVEKITTDTVNDKFNFNTNFNGQTKKKFVKISSVKGQSFYNTPNIHLHVAQREGDLELDLLDNTNGEDFRLVNIKIEPSIQDRWVVFNASNENIEGLIDFPDINSNISCSNEVPKPFKTVLETTRDRL